jgi:glutamine synthetase
MCSAHSNRLPFLQPKWRTRSTTECRSTVSSIDGYSRVQESDVLALPDANTFEVLPWADAKGAEARVFCDIAKLDGTAFDGDPRQVLKRNLNAAREKGYSFYIAPDIEYFYFAPPDGTNKPIHLMRVASSISPPPTSQVRCAKKPFAHSKP